jgi:hypothetical protein
MYKKILFTTIVATLLCYGNADVQATQAASGKKQCYDSCRTAYEEKLKAAKQRLTGSQGDITKKIAAAWILSIGAYRPSDDLNQRFTKEELAEVVKDMVELQHDYTILPETPAMLDALKKAVQGWEGKTKGEFKSENKALPQLEECRIKQGAAECAYMTLLKEAVECTKGCYKRFVKGTQ